MSTRRGCIVEGSTRSSFTVGGSTGKVTVEVSIRRDFTVVLSPKSGFTVAVSTKRSFTVEVSTKRGVTVGHFFSSSLAAPGGSVYTLGIMDNPFNEALTTSKPDAELVPTPEDMSKYYFIYL